jgi:hypothetical protein
LNGTWRIAKIAEIPPQQGKPGFVGGSEIAKIAKIGMRCLSWLALIGHAFFGLDEAFARLVISFAQ